MKDNELWEVEFSSEKYSGEHPEFLVRAHSAREAEEKGIALMHHHKTLSPAEAKTFKCCRAELSGTIDA